MVPSPKEGREEAVGSETAFPELRFGHLMAPRPPAGPTPPVTGATLVTGAAGFLGRAVVAALSKHGDPVVALVRRPEQGPALEALGARVVVGSVLDPASLERAAHGCTDFLHLASAEGSEDTAPTDVTRVRVEGVQNLARAARMAGGRRLVLGSGYWVYAGNPGMIEEDSRTEPAGESRNNFDAEQAGAELAEQEGLEFLVVRPAMVYGDGAWFRPLAEAVRAGTYRVTDGGANLWSFVSLPDTAVAFRTILRDGRAGEVYNVADGAPTAWSDFARFVADELGRPHPSSLTRADAEGLYGPVIARHLLANRAVRPARLRALGWNPVYRSYREGIPPLLAAMPWP